MTNFIHQASHWNWAGLLFVALIFPAAVLLNMWLRRWSETIEGGRDRGKIKGNVYVVSGGVRITIPARHGVYPFNAIDSSNYQPPPHEHVYDLSRSRTAFVSEDIMVVGCAMQGCLAQKDFSRKSRIALVD